MCSFATFSTSHHGGHSGSAITALWSRTAKRTRVTPKPRWFINNKTTGTTPIPVRTATSAAASTQGAKCTTTTRTAATTTTYPLVPQHRHVAHRLAASYINRNAPHDRDSSNLADHKAPTTGETGARNRAPNVIAQTSAEDESAVGFVQRNVKKKKKLKAQGGLPRHTNRKVAQSHVNSIWMDNFLYHIGSSYVQVCRGRRFYRRRHQQSKGKTNLHLYGYASV